MAPFTGCVHDSSQSDDGDVCELCSHISREMRKYGYMDAKVS